MALIPDQALALPESLCSGSEEDHWMSRGSKQRQDGEQVTDSSFKLPIMQAWAQGLGLVGELAARQLPGPCRGTKH